MPQNELRNFVSSILKEKQLTGVEPEIIEKLTDDLESRLEDQINRAMINALNDEQLAEFEKLVDEKDTQKISSFFTDNGVPVQTIMTDTMARFRTAYLGS